MSGWLRFVDCMYTDMSESKAQNSRPTTTQYEAL